MTDDLPKIFEHATPRPAPPELRAPVLAAVGRELARQRKPRWERAFELAVAASLLVGVGLTAWLMQTEPAWQMAPAPPAAGRWARHESPRAEPHKRAKDVAGNDRYLRLLHELSQGRIPESL